MQWIIDTRPDGKLNNFEATASFLLPHDPVAKKCTTGGGSGKCSYGTISSVSSVDLKDGTGKSGVEFRYHKKAEYDALNEEQRSELHEYRESLQAAGGSGKLPKKSRKGGKSEPCKGSPSSKRKFKEAAKVKRLIAAAIAKEQKEPTPDAIMTDANAAAVNVLTALMKTQLTTANASAAIARLQQ